MVERKGDMQLEMNFKIFLNFWSSLAGSSNAIFDPWFPCVDLLTVDIFVYILIIVM